MLGRRLRLLSNPLWVTLLYAVGSITWIVATDALVHRLPLSPHYSPFLHTAKGLFYVLLSSTAILLLLRRLNRLHQQASRAVAERDRALQEARESEAHVKQLNRKSEEEFRTLVASVPYGIFRCTHDGKLLQVNRAMVQMLRYDSAEELLGSEVSLVCTEHGNHAQMLAELTTQGKLVGEVRWRRKDGQIIIVRLSAHRGLHSHEDSPYFEAIAEDITEQLQLAEQLRQAQKMEAVGLLAGGIAHDFNNILMAISGYAEVLTFQNSAPGVLHIAENIHKTAMRASRLTQQLLAFSRKQVLDPKVLDLGSLVMDAVEMLRRVLGPKVQLLVSLDPHLGRIKADATQIDQILFNLVANARDAMPEGGSLTIALSNHDIVSGTPTGVRVPAGRWVELRVTDSGIGMDSETRQRICEPFFTTKPQGKGTGLGLSMVYGIVHQSGGHLLVDSAPGCGATFRIFLPRSEAEAAAATQPSQQALAIRVARNLLLVEDEQPVRECLVGFLQSCGYSVLVAQDGHEAVELAESSRQPIDLVVSDIVLPGISGPEAAERVLAKHPDAKIVYISGFVDDRLAKHGIEPERCLQKPFALQTLQEMLKRVAEPSPPAPN